MLLNTSFTTNFTSTSQTTFTPENKNAISDSQDNSFQINITYDNVLCISCQTSSSAAGPDGIKCGIIRSVALLITQPLFIIYQQSIVFGIFQTVWNHACVVPEYKKKGSRDDPQLNCLISLCITFGKQLKKLINNQLMEFIKIKNLLSSIQHVFYFSRSTATNLLVTDK